MELVKKVWHDKNSEPPKNYLWDKGGKLFKYTEGQWKEISKKDSGEDSSEKTINFADTLMELGKVSSEMPVGVAIYDSETNETIYQRAPDAFLVFEYKDDIYNFGPSDDLVFVLKESNSGIDAPWGGNYSGWLPEIDDNPNPNYDKAKSVEFVTYDNLDVEDKNCLVYAMYKLEGFTEEPTPNGAQDFAVGMRDKQSGHFSIEGQNHSAIFVVDVNGEWYFGFFYGD